MSRLGVISKVRHGKFKHRIVSVVKQSKVRECTKKVHRVPLPRATDVVYDILDAFVTGRP